MHLHRIDMSRVNLLNETDDPESKSSNHFQRLKVFHTQLGSLQSEVFSLPCSMLASPLELCKVRKVLVRLQRFFEFCESLVSRLVLRPKRGVEHFQHHLCSSCFLLRCRRYLDSLALTGQA